MRCPSVLLFALLGAASCPAQQVQLRFTGPEVLKLGWNTRCPRVADFNDDGRPDLALINQDRSRIEFLLQGKDGAKLGDPETVARTDLWNPILELSRFQKQPLVVGAGMYALVTGDWNGDSRPDIAYTTDDGKLVLRMHGKEIADWTQKKEFTLDSVSNAGDSLLAADLNSDKRTDIIIVTQTRLVLFIQGEKGQWPEPKTYALTGKDCSSPQAVDLNADGRTDLFCTNSEGDALLVRLQSESGGFGEEWRLEIAESQSWVKSVRLGKQNAFAWLQANTGMVELATLTTATSAQDADRSASITHAIPPSDSKAGATAFGDVTGDSIDDVVIAEPKAARVWLFQGRKDGSFDQGKEYPSLSGIEIMVVADADQDKKPDLILFSSAEKTIGLARWNGSRLDYPETIHQTTDTLMGLAVGKFAEGKDPAIVTYADKKPKPQLVVLRWTAADKKFTHTALDVPNAPSRVSGISLLDADQDERGDIALFSALSPMQLLLSRADAKAPLKKVEGLADSITAKLSASAVSMADIDADGKKDIIIAREQLARVVHVDKNGQAKVVDQYNAPDTSAQLTAAIAHGDKDPTKRRVLLIDGAGQKMHELRSNADGVFRTHSTKSLGSAGSVDDVRLLGTEAAQRLILLRKQSFEVLPLTGASLALSRLATFTTELKDTSPVDLIAAPFGGGDTDNLLLMDTKKSRVAEFFRSDSPEHKSWRSFMYFRIFQADPHYRGKAGFEFEPHDYTTADINADGRADLCLLVHDRLLLYVQE